MIKGETIEVVSRSKVMQNAIGEYLYAYSTTEVDDVLVSPGQNSDMGADRPDGIDVSFTLYFPKTFKSSLRGCSFVIRGEEYDVVGDPQSYTESNVPGKWNLACEVVRRDG